MVIGWLAICVQKQLNTLPNKMTKDELNASMEELQ